MRTAEEIIEIYLDSDRTKASIKKCMEEYANQFKTKLLIDKTLPKVYDDNKELCNKSCLKFDNGQGYCDLCGKKL